MDLSSVFSLCFLGRAILFLSLLSVHGCVYRTRPTSLPWIEQAAATSGDSMLSSD